MGCLIVGDEDLTPLRTCGVKEPPAPFPFREGGEVLFVVFSRQILGEHHLRGKPAIIVHLW